jgi:hypothetical protein
MHRCGQGIATGEVTGRNLDSMFGKPVCCRGGVAAQGMHAVTGFEKRMHD